MRLALAQMDIVWEDKVRNQENCLKFLQNAQQQKVQMIIFPEMTLTGFSMNIERIGEIENETVEWFKNKAQQFGMYIGFGYVQKINNKQNNSVKGKNNFCIVSPEGNQVIRYTKIHPFSFGEESKFYEAGNNIESFTIDDITLSPFICYDLRFPEIFQIASAKAQLIIVIANWPKSRRTHWITLLKARAIENQCYIAGVNRVGKGNGLSYSGDSMIIDPLGNILAEGCNQECLITAQIYLQKVEEVRNHFKVKLDRKEALYSQYYTRKNH